jgi:hypothetical protein
MFIGNRFAPGISSGNLTGASGIAEGKSREVWQQGLQYISSESISMRGRDKKESGDGATGSHSSLVEREKSYETFEEAGSSSAGGSHDDGDKYDRICR